MLLLNFDNNEEDTLTYTSKKTFTKLKTNLKKINIITMKNLLIHVYNVNIHFYTSSLWTVNKNINDFSTNVLPIFE